PFAAKCVVYLLNRTLNVDGKKAFELMYGRKPMMNKLHEFGKVGLALHGKKNLKLSSRGRLTMFSGYEKRELKVFWLDEKKVGLARTGKFTYLMRDQPKFAEEIECT